MTPQNNGHKTEATYKMGHKTVTLGIKDGEEIKSLLVQYLDTASEVSSIPLLNKDSDAWVLKGDEVWIGEDDEMHIGVWALRVLDAHLVLVYRSGLATGKFGYQYFCHLGHDHNDWRINTITYSKISPAR